MATLFPFNSSEAADSRKNTHCEGQGYYAETYPRGACSSSTIMVTQRAYYQSIGLARGDVVTNILAMCQTLGSGFSGINMKGAIYTKTGATLLAVTGDISAAYGSVGPKASPLVLQSNNQPLIIPETDIYWLALLAIATTPPTLMRGATSHQSTGGFGSGIGSSGAWSGQSDLGSSATITSDTNGIPFWMGVN